MRWTCILFTISHTLAEIQKGKREIRLISPFFVSYLLLLSFCSFPYPRGKNEQEKNIENSFFPKDEAKFSYSAVLLDSLMLLESLLLRWRLLPEFLKGQGKEDIGVTSYFSLKHMKHDRFFITFSTALIILQSLFSVWYHLTSSCFAIMLCGFQHRTFTLQKMWRMMERVWLCHWSHHCWYPCLCK